MARRAIKVGVVLLAAVSINCGSSPVRPAAEIASPQQNRGQPGDPIEIALWPKDLAIAKPELTGPPTGGTGGRLVAGHRYSWVGNVERPTMTIYPAKGHNTGAALMVYPGGGYEVLATDIEGSEVCDWATARGITCVVLKYRVPQTWGHKDCDCQRKPDPFLPLEDAQRAMGLLRQRAASLGVDPHKIGVIGFSAGGHLVTAISNGVARGYKPVDAADSLSARPNFAIALYPGHLWSGKGAELYPFDPVVAECPPTLIVQAEDDPVDDVRNSIAYFLALKDKKVPVEMHIYAQGGHAFGLRPTGQPITHWPELAEKWLRGIGML